MEPHDWLEITEVLEYNPELGQKCTEDPENDWSNCCDDGLGEDIDNEENDG